MGQSLRNASIKLYDAECGYLRGREDKIGEQREQILKFFDRVDTIILPALENVHGKNYYPDRYTTSKAKASNVSIDAEIQDKNIDGVSNASIDAETLDKNIDAYLKIASGYT